MSAASGKRVPFARFLTNTAVWTIGFTVALTAFVYRQATSTSEFGMNEVSIGDLLNRPLLVGIMCFSGILTKSLYDGITEPHTQRSIKNVLSIAFSARGVLAAMIVTPITIFSIYEKVATLDDSFLVALISYQSGFFFQSILGKSNREHSHASSGEA